MLPIHHRHGVTAGSLGGPPYPDLLTSARAPAFAFGVRSVSSRRALLNNSLKGIVVVCVLLPLWFLASDRIGLGPSSSIWAPAPASGHGMRSNDRKMMSEPSFPAAHLVNLVLVAGHAVYTGVDFSQATLESSWFLEEYQKVPGEAQSFVDHIEMGVKAAADDPSALLLFSGGQTRREAGPRSEGLSYWVVAEAAGWFNTSGVRNRTFTEEHARDSFENLLFGLCRFYELTGHYPSSITVVSYTLKRDRFFTLHREALRFPADRFDFIGTPVPPEAKGAAEGEARTVAAFQENPYGCTGELLEKRLRRDPFAVGPIHPSRCPEMRPLLTHCSSHLFEGKVPWK